MERETNGVLPAQQLEDLIAHGNIVSATPWAAAQVQPASLDLRLGRRAHRVLASFLPGTGKSVEERIENLRMETFDLRNGALLERDCVYIAEVQEELVLPEEVAGKANPKSTTGRLDIFTRLLSDDARRFNRVEAGYDGPLFAEIVPRAFSVRVAEGSSLMQLRLYRGRPECTDAELEALERDRPLTLTPTGEPASRIDNGVNIRISLAAGARANAIAAYQARRNTRVVDLRDHGGHPWEGYWTPVRRPADGELILAADEFYLMRSMERIRVPADHAAEMVPFDPDVGEFRIHYAGFFDPGFGCGDAADGTPAVLEVRSHESALLLSHGQQVGRLVYSRLTEPAERPYGAGIGSTYNRQELQLAKQFTRPGPDD